MWNENNNINNDQNLFYFYALWIVNALKKFLNESQTDDASDSQSVSLI